MSCRRCEARLAPLLDGDLRAGERAWVLRHVAGCRSCAALWEELRVVDGLLLRPGEVRLEADFTGATMAEVRDLPCPVSRHIPVAALIVCYLVGSWLLLAAALILSPLVVAGAVAALLHGARTVVDALGGVGRLIGRLAAWSLAADMLLFLALLAAIGRARPGIAERLRS